MARPITLFTGQWADLPFEEVARLASEWGYDGLEIACWGDHLDVRKAAEDDAYVRNRLDVLEKYNLKVWTISNHLLGQAVCDDPIDQRHQAILPAHIWGDGSPEGVRQRAAEEMATTDRWNPILDVFDEVGVRFAHEVHPSEIAYDYWSTMATLEAIGHRETFGLNWDPSHFVWQDLDPVGFLWDFKDRITTSTARTRSARSATAATAGWVPTWPGATRGAAGTSSPPATATSPGRRASGCSTRSATTARSRLSGRTPAWTAW
jgi:sugar phosphate isomerase/epimerase